MASREDQLKKLSLQALKLVDDFSQNLEVDMSESFEPFFQEWESVHEMAGIPVDEAQRETMEKLRRPSSVPAPLSIQEDREDEFLPEMLDSGPMRRVGIRRFSFGSENSLDVRDRKRSYEASMDTLWSSSSTFSINIDNRDEDYDENAGIFIDSVLGSGSVFVGGSEPNLLEGRSREGTLSGQDYSTVDAVEGMDTSIQVMMIDIVKDSQPIKNVIARYTPPTNQSRGNRQVVLITTMIIIIITTSFPLLNRLYINTNQE